MSKTVVITGASSGIGLETTRELLRRGHHVYALVRNPGKMEGLRERLPASGKMEVVACDLESTPGINAAAGYLLQHLNQLDVLINNAGGIFPGLSLNAEGRERTFAVNHLGHFLLTSLLMPLLLASRARVINVSSEAHRMGRLNFDNLELRGRYTAIQAYANAKLMNIYFTKELHKRYHSQGLSAFCLHPGVVNTGFGQEYKGPVRFFFYLAKPFMITAEQGAQTTLYLSEEAPTSDSGNYFKKSKLTQPAAQANDMEVANLLWEKSEEILRSGMH